MYEEHWLERSWYTPTALLRKLTSEAEHRAESKSFILRKLASRITRAHSSLDGITNDPNRNRSRGKEKDRHKDNN
jgi:hypothetical protein